MALVNYDNSDNELTDSGDESTDKQTELAGDKVEPEYKMRVPKSASRVNNNLPPLLSNLVTSKTKTGKVLLSVPALEELDSSSDEDNTGVSKSTKKVNTKPGAQSTGGLLSLLPPTRTAVGREGQKPTVMIPHQLSVKRPTPGHLVNSAHLETNPTNGSSAKPEDNDSDIDDGDDTELDSSTPFFSFVQPSLENDEAVASVRAAAASSVVLSMRSESSKVHVAAKDTPLEANLVSYSHTSTESSIQNPTSSTSYQLDPTVVNEFKAQKKESMADEDEASMEEEQCWTEHTFVPGPERKRARLLQPGTRSLPVQDILATSNQPIREVNQSDLTAGADLELIKSVTADDSQYRSQRASQEDDPGKLAHRKHQITWLAHQAQENEIELERRWAEARRNKATSRAKYGF